MDTALSPETCRLKALDYLLQADTLLDSAERAEVLHYAEWWK